MQTRPSPLLPKILISEGRVGRHAKKGLGWRSLKGHSALKTIITLMGIIRKKGRVDEFFDDDVTRGTVTPVLFQTGLIKSPLLVTGFFRVHPIYIAKEGTREHEDQIGTV